MAKGQSGRVVIEVEPALKRALYGALALESSTLKEWFTVKAKEHVSKTKPHNSEKEIQE